MEEGKKTMVVTTVEHRELHKMRRNYFEMLTLIKNKASAAAKYLEVAVPKENTHLMALTQMAILKELVDFAKSQH